MNSMDLPDGNSCQSGVIKSHLLNTFFNVKLVKSFNGSVYDCRFLLKDASIWRKVNA